MGRRRRKIVRRRVVKPPPKVFVCPICNQEAVAVYHEEGEEYARVVCASCKASAEVRWYPAYTSVDAYAEFYDIITGAKKVVEPSGSEALEIAEPGGEDSDSGGESNEASQDRED